MIKTETILPVTSCHTHWKGWVATAHVRAFQNGRLANGFVYSVDLPVALEFKQWTGIAAIAPLVESAKNDILNCSREKIQNFFGKNESFAA